MKQTNVENPEVIKITTGIQEPNCSHLTKTLLQAHSIKEVYEYWQFLDELRSTWSYNREIDRNEE